MQHAGLIPTCKELIESRSALESLQEKLRREIETVSHREEEIRLLRAELCTVEVDHIKRTLKERGISYLT